MNNKDLFINVSNYLLKFKFKIILLILFDLISTILSTIQPILFSNIINYITYKEFLLLKQNIYLLIICFFISLLFQLIQSLISYNLTYSIELDLKNKLFTNTLNMSLINFENTENGKLLNKFENDIQTFSNLFIKNISIIIDIFTVFIIAFILVKINFLLAIITFFSFPISFVVFSYFGKKIQQKEILFKNKYDQYLSYLQEVFIGYKTIKTMNNFKFFIKKFNETQKELYKLILKKFNINISGTLLMQLLNFISYILLIVIGVFQIFKNKLTLGGLVAFNTYSNTFNSSLFKLCNLNITLQESLISIKRISYLFDVDFSKTSSTTDFKETDTLKNAEIITKNLSFKYKTNSKNIINNLNIKIPKDSFTIIKGESGLGKTTLLNLLSGLYKDYEGEIFVGKENLKNIDSNNLNKTIFLTLQEPILFSDSIKNNLLLANPNADKNLVVSLCKKLNIHSYINSLPSKYNTQIGVNETNLSIGQKQRICLIRSLLTDSSIYLFDEITSALDSENELIVMNLLKDLSKTKTVVLVTHNKNCFKFADNIIDLNKLN
ncbi:ATP-binding cassette domain-containing protein [Clostridium perfringens]